MSFNSLILNTPSSVGYTTNPYAPTPPPRPEGVFEIDPRQQATPITSANAPQYDNVQQQYRIRRGFNPAYAGMSNLAFGVTEGLSNLSGNSFEKATQRYNQQRMPFQNVGLTNYTTQQDQRGSRTYFQTGGVFDLLASNALEYGDEEGYATYSRLASRREQAQEMAMRQSMMDYYNKNQRAEITAPVKSKTYMDHSSPYVNYSTYQPRMSYSGPIDFSETPTGSWAEVFKRVEDPSGKFNHGNGAYGSFGYRENGHLKEAFTKAPEFADLRKQYKNYNDFWKTFKNKGYSEFSTEIDTRYENWLKRRSENSIDRAASINYVGSVKPNNYRPKGQLSVGSYKQRMGIFEQGGMVNNTGYTPGTKSYNNPYNIIPSNNITMKDTPFPVLGIDNTGQQQMMYPGGNYKFRGNSVLELPIFKK